MPTYINTQTHQPITEEEAAVILVCQAMRKAFFLGVNPHLVRASFLWAVTKSEPDKVAVLGDAEIQRVS